MLVRAMPAEVDPRRDRHARFFQHVMAEAIAVGSQAAAAGIDIEGALRLHRDLEAEIAQGRQQIVALCLELRPVLLDDAQRLRREGGACGLLSDIGVRDVEVLRQLLDGPDILRRRHHPAQTPAGHAKVFRETADDEDVVGDLESAAGIAAVGEAVVDLVDDECSAPVLHHVVDAPQFVHGHQRAGGIGRRGDHHRDGARRPVPLHERRGQLVSSIGADGNAHGAPLHRAHEVPVARVAGIGHQHFVTGREQRAHGQQQRARRAAGDADARRRDLDAVTGAIPAGQRRSQLGRPERRRVADLVTTQSFDGGVDDRLGRREVGLADDHVDDAAALGLERLGTRHQHHHVERLDLRHAAGQSQPRARGHSLGSIHAGFVAGLSADRAVGPGRL